jgi:hypothetical protein
LIKIIDIIVEKLNELRANLIIPLVEKLDKRCLGEKPLSEKEQRLNDTNTKQTIEII